MENTEDEDEDDDEDESCTAVRNHTRPRPGNSGARSPKLGAGVPTLGFGQQPRWGCPSANPNGIPSSSPRLRGTSYLG